MKKWVFISFILHRNGEKRGAIDGNTTEVVRHLK